MIIVFSVLAIGFNEPQLAFAGSCADEDADDLCGGPDGSDPDDSDPCVPNLNSPACIDSQVGGEIIPIDSTALLLAGVKANYSILTALAVVGAGAGFAALKLKQK